MTTISAVAYRFDSFQSLPVRHGMSGRQGSMPFQGDVGHSPVTDAESIEENRRVFLSEIGIDLADLVVARQAHGSTVRVVTRDDRGRGLFPLFDGFPATDGLLSNDPAVAVGVIIADCVPIVLYDPRRHALAVIHAGWRGTVGMITAAAVERMAEAFGTRPSDIVAGIGPSIGPCCYEVGDEVIERWGNASGSWGAKAVRRTDMAYHFDLWTANRLILLAAGVGRGRIEDSVTCVRCAADRYFSYRVARQQGAQHGRMMMAAQLEDCR